MYINEIKKLSENKAAKRTEEINDRPNSNVGENRYVTINSADAELTGIRVGSRRNDLSVFFGDDYVLQTDNGKTHIIYHVSYSFDPTYSYLTFVIGEDERVKEIIYTEGWRK
jgi:hypothetical protein